MQILEKKSFEYLNLFFLFRCRRFLLDKDRALLYRLYNVGQFRVWKQLKAGRAAIDQGMGNWIDIGNFGDFWTIGRPAAPCIVRLSLMDTIHYKEGVKAEVASPSLCQKPSLGQNFTINSLLTSLAIKIQSFTNPKNQYRSTEILQWTIGPSLVEFEFILHWNYVRRGLRPHSHEASV